MTPALAGIFVGGTARRMGGVAKGLLRTADGTTIVERWRGMLEPLDIGVVLVGSGNSYSALGIEVVADEPSGIGPLGGILALLRRAGDAPALALACDMPFVSVALVQRLLAASHDAPIVAPHRHGRWEPFCARYNAATVLAPALARARTSDHSLQRLLHDAGAIELALTQRESHELDDWDTPDDVRRMTSARHR